MKNKLLFIFSILFLLSLTACKKNKLTTSGNYVIDPVGTWTMFSSSGTTVGNPVISSRTASEFPCLANNKLTLSSDLSSVAFYAGTDTCYLAHSQNFTEIEGKAGDTTRGSYKVIGHSVYLTNQYSTYVGVLFDSANVHNLVFRDTIANNIYISWLTK